MAASDRWRTGSRSPDPCAIAATRARLDGDDDGGRMRRMRVCVVLGLMLTAATAFAQDNAVPKAEPIGWFAADVRGAFVNFKAPSTVAADLGVDPLDLPSHGLGIVVGAHVYPLHMGPVTLGLGAELLNSRGTRSQAPTTEGGQPGPTTETRFTAFSPQASLNF